MDWGWCDFWGRVITGFTKCGNQIVNPGPGTSHHTEPHTEPHGSWLILGTTLSVLLTITIKGGKTLILKNNVEIMIPKAERINILNIAHQTHLDQEMMVKQLSGKVFWNKMSLDISTW